MLSLSDRLCVTYVCDDAKIEGTIPDSLTKAQYAVLDEPTQLVARTEMLWTPIANMVLDMVTVDVVVVSSRLASTAYSEYVRPVLELM